MRRLRMEMDPEVGNAFSTAAFWVLTVNMKLKV